MSAQPRRTRVSDNTLVAFAQTVWAGVWTALKGLRVTGYNSLLRRRVTVCYPFEKLDVSPRVRGRHRQLLDAHGDPICIACGACVRICPDACIAVTRKRVTVTTPAGEEKQVNRPETFVIDLARCMYCNLCAEACPVDCLHLTADYAYSTGDIRELTVGMDVLSRPEPLSEFELESTARRE